MKVPLEWLKEYVSVRLSPEALAQRLTMAGLEVVGILDVAGQSVFDLDITPNRPDWLSVIGVAREVAAVTGQRLKLPLARGSKLGARGKCYRSTTQSPQPRTNLSIRIEDRTGCARYIGRLIEGVKVGPSPSWMQKRLIACGARPINNLVDITNYVLFEYGQPLHAFDYNLISDGAIVVRRAFEKEPITTLDDDALQLQRDMLVIADAKETLAIAGVMGGRGSEVSDATKTVLLESAQFDPITVRRTARSLGLATESSYRFERGIDPAGVERASARAAALILELAGGRLIAVKDAGSKPASRTVVSLEPERASRWLGIRVESSTIRTNLVRLGCRVASVSSERALRVTVPSFRRDLVQDVDLIEELARLIGYDRIPDTLPEAAVSAGRMGGFSYAHLQSIKCLCASLGLVETISWSLVSEADLARCGYNTSSVARLLNPISQDHAFLRPSLLVGVLRSVRRNYTQGAEAIRLFETGNVFRRLSEDRSKSHIRIVEEPWVGLAISGLWSRDWKGKSACDFFRLKGLIQALVRRLCEANVQLVSSEFAWGERGRCAKIYIDDRPLGMAGQVSRALAQRLDIQADVWFAELSVASLFRHRRAVTLVKAQDVFPPVKRDISILVSDETSYEAIEGAIRKAAGPLASRIELIDCFTGSQLPHGKHSLTFSIAYRDAAKTLTAEEADGLHKRVSSELERRFQTTLR